MEQFEWRQTCSDVGGGGLHGKLVESLPQLVSMADAAEWPTG